MFTKELNRRGLASILLGIIILIGVGCTGLDKEDGFLEEDKTYGLELTDRAFDFDDYRSESEYLILSFYEVEDGKLLKYIDPSLDKDLYEYYSDNIDHSTSGLYELQDKKELHDLIWESVLSLIPQNFLNQIQFFEVFTDGYEETLGSVEDISDRSSREEAFILSLDLLDMFDKDMDIDNELLEETVIHELGHIITLAPAQLNAVSYENSNPNTFYLYDDEVDTKEGSYLNLFFQKFWPEIYDEWDAIDYYQFQDEDKYYRLLDEFYSKHESQFVSDYAATNPVEDIAESFMAFVIQEKPRSNSIKSQKTLFFYDFPELVEVRDHYWKTVK